MNIRNLFFFCVAMLWVCCRPVMAQQGYTLYGTITNEQNVPLAYASVVVDNAKYGTVSDENGAYKLMLPEGPHVLFVSYLGYARKQDTIYLSAPLEKNYSLVEEILSLEEVLITDGERDPAMGIMERAIRNKKKNATPFQQYKYDAYTKTKVAFQEGFEVDSLLNAFRQNLGQQSVDGPTELLKADYLFLSENISTVTIRNPGKIKEEILSSRVSGDSEQFSFIGNFFTRFDPYQNRFVLSGIADRGIVSPLSDNAFFFYKFKLLGIANEKGSKYYKIQLLPRRANDPVWEGTIYILDDSYAVKEIDWAIEATRPIELLDTLVIRQEFQPLDTKWIPFKTQFQYALEFNLLFMNIPLSASSLSISTDFNTDLIIPKKFFSKEIIAISDSALEKDRDYWSKVRPIPLQVEESRDYQFKDSLELIYKSDTYLDSLTKANQKLGLMGLLVGKSFRNYRKKTIWRFNSILNASGYTAQEGLFLQLGVDRIWEFEKGRRLSIGPSFRYGFSNKQFSYKFNIQYNGKDRVDERFQFSFGDYPAQFSSFPQISYFNNTMFALIRHRNHIKLFRKRYVESSYERELINGLKIRFSASYQDRTGMENTSDFSILAKDRTYRPNLPLNPHKLIKTEIRLRYQAFNKYIRTPSDKINLGSSFPLLEFVYQRAFPFVEDRDPSFELIQIGISNQLKLGLLGNLRWRLTTGKFLEERNVTLVDAFHVKGNETPFHSTRFDEFLLLPFYETSSTATYAEGHIEQAFDGFIFNKLPWLRRLKMRSYVGLHALWQENRIPYMELNVGISKRIFKVFPLRIDFIWRVAGESRGRRYSTKPVDPIGG